MDKSAEVITKNIKNDSSDQLEIPAEKKMKLDESQSDLLVESSEIFIKSEPQEDESDCSLVEGTSFGTCSFYNISYETDERITKTKTEIVEDITQGVTQDPLDVGNQNKVATQPCAKSDERSTRKDRKEKKDSIYSYDVDMDDIDTDLEIIKQVQSFKHLWDKKEMEYKNKVLKKNTFKYIGQQLSLDPDYVEQRWLVLRQKFSKERKLLHGERKPGQPRKRPWYLFEKMLFMNDNVLQRNRTYVPKYINKFQDFSGIDEGKTNGKYPSITNIENDLIFTGEKVTSKSISASSSTIEEIPEPEKVSCDEDFFNQLKNSKKKSAEADLITAAQSLKKFFANTMPEDEDVNFAYTMAIMLKKKSKKKRKQARLFILNYLQELSSDDEM